MDTGLDERRKTVHSDGRHPQWPEGVRAISFDDMSFLGVQEDTGELYWDGRKIVVRKPVTLGLYERIVAGLAAAGAFGVFIIEFGRSMRWWQG